MNLYVGTSGYSYKEWKGSFYPKDLSPKKMLRYYGEQFRTVEINNTFYRMPKTSVVEGWAAEVPHDFRFALKAPQRITHILRLKDAKKSLSDFLEVAGALKKRLGPVLFQLPPNLKRDLPRLTQFLKLLPATSRAAIEFRHPSWFDEAVFGLLRDRRVALCVAEDAKSVETPLVVTADFGYLRLRRASYTDSELKKWVKWVRQQPWNDAFAFFKHEDQGKGPKLAQRFLALAAD